jgi:hypothetical protein
MAISLFGYPTYEDFQKAQLRTAHTAQVLAEFSITEEEHRKKIAKRWLHDPRDIARRAERVVEFLQKELRWREAHRTPVNGKYFGSPGWWWEHPVTRPDIPTDLLAWVEENCNPEPPCLYREKDGRPTIRA